MEVSTVAVNKLHAHSLQRIQSFTAVLCCSTFYQLNWFGATVLIYDFLITSSRQPSSAKLMRER